MTYYLDTILTNSYRELFVSTTTLSSKGQVIIPKPIRTQHHWVSGQQFEAIDTPEGVLLKPAGLFPHTSIDDVASCLDYQGPAKTLAEMEDAICRGVKELSRDRN